ncbi:NADH dehydrogenase [ubiquinone] 1 alpha subcomplex assembly factor 8 [Amia ocellicauda]|uniref:NADH dehydrogenase [ubiquinone] 1 alpha subcomplex assembly factor 8 n=1 Tax=Amia ocellicauda TaxID=2972642 RepID=UPI003463C556
MSGSNVWARSRDRLRRFPELLTQCGAEAAAYGKCVSATTTTGTQELRKGLCAREFEALKRCFVSAAKKSVK